MGFTGRIWNLIHYVIGNEFFMRSATGKVRQTKASKARAAKFGRASGIGKDDSGTVVYWHPQSNLSAGREASGVLFHFFFHPL
jgi:hypothetical protein